MLAIKSVPMPTTCGNCMFGRSLMDTFGDAYCAIFPTLPTQVGVRPDWCPLEDVPPRMRGRWIPVEQELPKDCVTVWVTKMSRVSEGFWCEDEKAWYNANGYPMMVQPVAWMPITRPKPWRGEEHEL